MTSAVTLTPIAHVRSPYREKFGTPRQSGLVDAAVGEVHFEPAFSDPNMLRGLEQFSHLWLLYVFHATMNEGWKATVTPPRLGGQTRMGVFATRSNFRPNPIGLSLVRFEGIEQQGARLVLKVRGLELLDGTPVVDIKPYLPYADARPEASGGFAAQSPGTSRRVIFTTQARAQLLALSTQYPTLESFITTLLQQDPRPAQHIRQETAREYGMLLYDLNIRWHIEGQQCVVSSIDPAGNHPHE
jgi:tRNA-Thr(GGU) m(6)t(6)A37 methyltransferase TsaA